MGPGASTPPTSSAGWRTEGRTRAPSTATARQAASAAARLQAVRRAAGETAAETLPEEKTAAAEAQATPPAPYIYGVSLDRAADPSARLLAAHTPCQLSSSGRDNLEVMAPGGGKGRALAFLMGRLGLKKEQVMAFGDSTNDLDMLGAAGWPVAMGNALDVVKALAWRVAPSCDQDGVARTLQECVLGNSAMEAQA